MKRLFIFSCMILIAFLILCGRLVADDGMSVTLYDGDVVIILPLTPKIGDVVAIHDPLQQSRLLFRRLMAREYMNISVDQNGSVIHNTRRITQKDMGVLGLHRVIEERFEDEHQRIQTWRITRLVEPVVSVVPKQKIPAEHIYLLADQRDETIDSRIWGPVREDSIYGVVWMVIGHSDPWRRVLSWM